MWKVGKIVYIEWLKKDSCRETTYIFLSILTIGIVPIITVLFPSFGARLRAKKCEPFSADYIIGSVYIDEDSTKEYVADVNHLDTSDGERVLSTELNCQRYVASSIDNFELYVIDEVPQNFKRFLKLGDQIFNESMVKEERELLFLKYGKNEMRIPTPTTFEITVRHAFNPIVVFGYFATIIWYIEDYFWYATLVVVLVVLTIISLVSATKYNLRRLTELAGELEPVSAIDSINQQASCLVPGDSLVVGDYFVIKEGAVLPCDAVLLTGRVVVDESMLTGESVPITKIPIDVLAMEETPFDDVPLITCRKPPRLEGAVLTQSSLESSANAAPADSSTKSNFFVPVENDLAEKFPGSILYGGTRIKHCIEGRTVAVTYRTGFRSAKGQLISSLIEPKEGFLQFFDDMIAVIIVIFLIATVIYACEIYYIRSYGESWSKIAILYFNVLTIAIPIALIACLIGAVLLGMYRLSLKEIYVSDLTRINYAGIVDCVCFDKTGTLTEEEMEFKAAFVSTKVVEDEVGSESGSTSKKSYSLWGSLSSGGKDVSEELGMIEFDGVEGSGSLPRVVLEVMGACHSLSLIGSLARPVGDPMEAELLRATGWSLSIDQKTGRNICSPKFALTSFQKTAARRSGKDKQVNVSGYEILRHFEFTSERMRTASLVCPHGKVNEENCCSYIVKGSPEVIASLCNPSSIPPQATEILNQLTKRGWRVIAMAYRSFKEPGSTLVGHTQTQLEGSKELQYVGLLALSSRLKPDTKKTIAALHNADVHVNMITGDHVLTAVSVAYECGILLPPPAVLAAMNSKSAANKNIEVEEVESPPIPLVPNEKQSTLDYSVYIVDGDEFLSIQLLDGVTNAVIPRAEMSLSRLLHAAFRSQAVQIAVTGRGLAAARERLSFPLLYLLLTKAVVFARAKPNDKRFIVQQLMKGPPDVSTLLALPPSTEGTSTNSTNVDGGNKVAVDAVTVSSPNPTNTLSDDVTSSRETTSLQDQTKSRTEKKEVTIVGEVDGVMFCGDGANDMAALRASTVGVSLCEVETSIAAPVTAKYPSPGVVIDVLLEGRGSLVNAYVLVNFNVMYAVIQLLMTCLLYGYGIMVSDSMYYIQGWAFTLFPGIAILLSPIEDKLSPDLPARRYFSPELLAALIPQCIIFTCFQLISLYILSIQSFYTKFETDDPFNTTDDSAASTYSYEATTLENVVLGQLMIASVVATIGYPFRKEWYENQFHVALLALQTGWLLYQIFAGDSYFAEDLLDLEPVPFYFSWYIIAIIVANAVVSGLCWMLVYRVVKAPPRGRKRVALKSASLVDSLVKENGDKGSLDTRGKTDEKEDTAAREESSPLILKVAKV